MIFPVDLLTRTKRPAFSTNQKTKLNMTTTKKQHKNLSSNISKLLTYARSKPNEDKGWSSGILCHLDRKQTGPIVQLAPTNRLCQQTDGISGCRLVSGQVRLLRLRLTVQNIEQSDGQTQQITEAIEAEVDEMTGKFHNLKHTQSHIIGLRRAGSNISTGWPSNCVI